MKHTEIINSESRLAFEPVEVKVVEISGQARLCTTSPETEIKADALQSYSKVYF